MLLVMLLLMLLMSLMLSMWLMLCLLHRFGAKLGHLGASVGLKAFGWGPASEIYSLCFLKKVHGIGTLLEIDGFFGEQVSSRKLLPRVFPEELLPIST